MSKEYIKKNYTIATILTIILFFIRFSLVILYYVPKIKEALPISHLEIYYNSTYLLTMLFLFICRKRLEEYNIDILSIIILVLFPIITPITTKLFMEGYTSTWYNFGSFVALAFAITLIIFKYNFKKQSIKSTLKWVVIGILTGVIISVVYKFSYKLVYPEQVQITNKFDLKLIIIIFMLQLYNASSSEEPLFRSFIFRFLQSKKIKAFWVITIQALLFGICHLYYLPNHPLSIALSVVGGISFGVLVYKSKQLSSVLIAHGVLNATSLLLSF